MKPRITKQSTRFRVPIPPEERLAVTLRYLATGEFYESLMYQFRIHNTTISKIIQEVCQAIYKVLQPIYMRLPTNEEEWLEIAEKTYQRWNYPNCFGAADGKHIAIVKPKHSGSDFYNYKGFYSIVLMALVDYDYKFLAIDVGVQGRISDGGVFKNSALYRALENNTLQLPSPRPLPLLNDSFYNYQDDTPLPFVFVGDDAFQLTKYCMKPYGRKNITDDQRIFDYRLSRKRRVTENAFGIWVNRFRVFSVRNNLKVQNVSPVVLASVVLHNMLREKSVETYTPTGFVDEIDSNGFIREGTWRDEPGSELLCPLQLAKNNNFSRNARK